MGIKADKYGKEDAFIDSTPNQVIDKITEHEGMAILAHANSKQGIMGGMTGVPRTKIINNQNLIAVEATDFDNGDKKTKKTRVVDLLDGTDSNYNYRELAVYQASDNLSIKCDGKHSIEGIGSHYTYFKLDEISFEGLRQCFCDPGVRIKQRDEFEIKKFPKIAHLEVSQGFFKDQKICFHEGLNSIVGRKGVGKSLVTEFLRFGIDQSSKGKYISEDHKAKLEKRLEQFGKVSVEFEVESGEQYRAIRTYDGDDNKIECVNLETDEPYDDEMKLYEKKKKTFDEYLSFHDDLTKKIDQVITDLKDDITKPTIVKELIEDTQIQSIKKLSDGSYNKVVKSLETVKKEINRNKNAIFQSKESWIPEFTKKQRDYEVMLEKAVRNKKKLEGEQRKLESNKKR